LISFPVPPRSFICPEVYCSGTAAKFTSCT